MDVNEQLAYINGLIAKYGAWYIKKYFGFSLHELGEKAGIKRCMFTRILKGQKKMPKAHAQAFSQAFEDMQIFERTKDFQESRGQLLTKELYRKVKNSLTIVMIFATILTMVNIREYISDHRRKSNGLNKKVKAVVVKITTAAFFIFDTITTFFHAKADSEFKESAFSF